MAGRGPLRGLQLPGPVIQGGPPGGMVGVVSQTLGGLLPSPLAPKKITLGRVLRMIARTCYLPCRHTT